MMSARLLSAAPFLALAALSAQVNLGTILGTVADPSGAAAPGVKVSIQHMETGETRSVTTNETGYFEAPLLNPGSYRVEVEKEGFKREQRAGVAVQTGDRIRLNFVLAVGAVSETVEVTAETPIVKTDTSELGVVVDTRKITDLPLNGRSFIQLMGLQPGVVQGRGLNGRPTIHFGGLGARSSSFSVDGTDASFIETATPGDASGNSLINTVSVENIREFRVSANSFSAETGRTSGAAVNIVTKSGSNELHGTAFEFLRNDAFDSRNFFFTDRPVAPLRHNQFGGNLGGPIVKDHVFFFGGYEGVRLRRQQLITGQVPSLELRQTAPEALRPALNAYPTVYEPTANRFTGLHRRTDAYRDNENSYTGRVDFQWKRHTSFARANYNHFDQSNPALVEANRQIFPLRNPVITLSDSWLPGAATVNELRLGFNRNHTNRQNTTFPGGAGGVAVAGVFGSDFQSRLRFANNSYTVADTLSHVRGKHTLKMGFEVRRVQSSRIQQQNPDHNYANLEGLLANRPERVRVIFGNPGVGLRQTQLGIFVQDDYRITRKLTLNLGLRYEYYSVMNEVAGRLFNTKGDFFGAFNNPGESIYLPDRDNFDPRAGFAYDVFGNQKTVVRGGVGFYHTPLSPIFLYNLAFRGPTIPFFADVRQSDFPNLGFPFPRSIVDNPTLTTGVLGRAVFEYDRRDEYSAQWNLSVQRLLLPTVAVQATYAGNRGLKMMSLRTANNFDPALRRRPSTSIGEILVHENAGNSAYHSLQLSLNKKFSHGFSTDVYYTYSKALQYHSADQNAAAQTVIQDPDNIRGSRGPKEFDIPQVFTWTASWELPFARGLEPRAAKLLLDGWAVQTITNIRAGLPVNIYSGRDTRGNQIAGSQRPDYVSGVSSVPGDRSIHNWLVRGAFAFPAAGSFGNVGYNTERGPGVWNSDVSFLKNFRVREGHQLQFRAEMFNAFNHARFGQPVNTLTNPLFGRIITADTAREVQFALKYIF